MKQLIILISISISISFQNTWAFTPEDLPYLDELRISEMLKRQNLMEQSKSCLAKNIAALMDANFVKFVSVLSIRESFFFERGDYKINFNLAHNTGNDILSCSIFTELSDLDVIAECKRGKEPYIFNKKILNIKQSKSISIEKRCL